jgi:hypothetical protein
VTTARYRTALDAARRELDELLAKRGELDTRIAQLRQIVGTLAPLCGEPADLDLGLTDACRSVLRGSVALRAPDIRDRVQALGVDLSRYSNGLGAVHTVLKRLVEAGEVNAYAGYDKRTFFCWKYQPRTVGIESDSTANPSKKAAARRRNAGDRDDRP